MTAASHGAVASGAAPRRRGLRALIWTAGAVVVAVGLYFAADAVLRQIAEGLVHDRIEKELPSDVTAKDLSVGIGGFSVIGQLVTGRLDQVTLSSPDVRVQGNRLSARLTAYGVPLDVEKPVQRIDGSMTIGQNAVNGLVDLPNGTSVTLAHDEVGLTGTGTLLGIDVGYSASVTPTLKGGDTIVLTPRTVSITADGGPLDVTRFAKNLLPSSIPICIASYLPRGVEATGLTVRSGTAHVSVRADEFVIGDRSLRTRGSCG